MSDANCCDGLPCTLGHCGLPLQSSCDPGNDACVQGHCQVELSTGAPRCCLFRNEDGCSSDSDCCEGSRCVLGNCSEPAQ